MQPTKVCCSGQATVTSTDFRHDWLRLDINLTALPASEWAEGSEKGYFPQKKNATGRQLARLAAIDYREVLLSQLYPGGQTSLASLEPVVGELQRLLPFTWAERQRTLIRLDARFGDDAHGVSWLLPWGYQVLAKGYSGKQAEPMLGAWLRRLGTK